MSVMIPPGLAIELDEDTFGLGRDRFFKRAKVVRIGPYNVPAKIFVGVVELVDRSSVKLFRCNKLIAWRHHRMHYDDLGGMAGGNRQAGRAAFKRCDAFFQHGASWIANAGINVAEGLQPEQCGGVIDIVEHEGGRLIDRRDTGAGSRIGLGARMNRQCGKARCTFGVSHGTPRFKL